MNRRKKMNNNTPMSKLIFKISAILYVLITVIFFISIYKANNLIPEKFFSIFIIIEIIIGFLIVRGLIKNRKNIKINLICLLFAVLISTVHLVAINYINTTMDFWSSMFNQLKEKEEYYIVVRESDNKYNVLDDIKGENVAVFNLSDDVKKKFDNKFIEKNSLIEVGNNLLDKKENIILVSLSQYDMLCDEIESFKIKTKILYKLEYDVKITKEVSDVNSVHKLKDSVFNVYISGIDTSGKIANVSRSDANIIATVNIKTHEILLTSIPRDYYVALHTYKAKDKLTHSGIYGISETVATVEDFMGIDINYYIRVNFTTVIKLVDILGGINVYSDYDYTSYRFIKEGYHYKKGYNYLNGEQALGFSRERFSFAEGDNQRIKNQQHVIEAVINKALNGTTILTKYTSILNALKGSFQTNIDEKDISELVKEQLDKGYKWTVKTNVLTGTGSTNSTYSMGNTPLYVMIPNNSSIKAAREKIDEMMK